MSVLTNWGYTITDVDIIEPMVSADEFDEFTGGKYSGDGRTESNIKAASAAIRNYCGWHVYPSYSCELDGHLQDENITRVGKGLLIQLPAKFVSEVDSIVIDGVEYTEASGAVHFVAQTNGIIHVYGLDFSCMHPYTEMKVCYKAGISDALVDSIKELISHRVTHALASSGGIQSETAGGVSITYSANWTNSARSTALADDNKEVIAPYRLQGVF